MDSRRNRNLPTIVIVIIGLGYLVLGVHQITRGVSEYDAWEIMAGIGTCLLALVVAPTLGRSRQTRELSPRLERSLLVAGVIVCVLEASAFAAMVLEATPAAVLGLETRVTPVDLVRHPFLYNNQRVQVTGYLSSRDDWCTLEPTDRPAAATPHHAANTLFLAMYSTQCSPPVAPPPRVRVSGTFQAERTRRNWNRPYVLAHARVASMEDTTP